MRSAGRRCRTTRPIKAWLSTTSTLSPPAMRSSGHAAHSGGRHEGHSVADFRRRFWVSLALTVPVILISPGLPLVPGGRILDVPGADWILLALSTVLYVYGGMPFLKGFVRELRDRKPGMMTLVAVAISVAYFYSAATVLRTRRHALLLGARHPDRHHAARPLDRDALGRRGIQGAGIARPTHAVAGASQESRRHHDGRGSRAAAARRRGGGQARREGAGRRRRARGSLLGRRVDAHRRVGSGREVAGRPRHRRFGQRRGSAWPSPWHEPAPSRSCRR